MQLASNKPALEQEMWKKRLGSRNDMVIRLTHLTRGLTDNQAFDILWKILQDKNLIGSGKSGYIIGDRHAVCLQELPLSALVENLMFETMHGGKIRYSPFGIRFNKGTLYQKGARPVFYGDTEELKCILPKEEYWRIVSMNLLDPSNIVDWSHEREWRYPGNLEFEYSEIEIVVKNEIYYGSTWGQVP